nr:hypothetical protein [Tanacetum cinerariifolium]
MVEKSKLDEDKEGKAVDPSHYRGMIGTLLYLTAIRPNLQFSICMCARYQARPTEKHLHAVKRIFRYLRGTVNRGLWSKHIDIRYHFIKEQVENGRKNSIYDQQAGNAKFYAETLKQLADEVEE